MTTFRCGRFRTGVAHIRTAAGVVDFVDGRAEVDDEKLAAALREVPAVFQITEEGRAAAAADGDPAPKPRKRASKRAAPPAES
jgi:hypothetical protein